MTLLASFVVAAVPLGLLALVSAWASYDRFHETIFCKSGRSRWWEFGVALLLLAALVAVPFLLLCVAVSALGWAARTLGWIA